MKSLVASTPVEEGQKLSPTREVLQRPWEEFQGLSWMIKEEFQMPTITKIPKSCKYIDIRIRPMSVSFPISQKYNNMAGVPTT